MDLEYLHPGCAQGSPPAQRSQALWLHLNLNDGFSTTQGTGSIQTLPGDTLKEAGTKGRPCLPRLQCARRNAPCPAHVEPSLSPTWSSEPSQSSPTLCHPFFLLLFRVRKCSPTSHLWPRQNAGDAYWPPLLISCSFLFLQLHQPLWGRPVT